jgi:hypothetical protein
MNYLKFPLTVPLTDEISRRSLEEGTDPESWLIAYLERAFHRELYETIKRRSLKDCGPLSEEVAIVFEPGFTADSFPWVRESLFMPECKRVPSHFRKDRHRLVAYSVDANGKVVRYWHHKSHDDENMAKSPNLGPIEKVSLGDVAIGVLTHRQVRVFG